MLLVVGSRISNCAHSRTYVNKTLQSDGKREFCGLAEKKKKKKHREYM